MADQQYRQSDSYHRSDSEQDHMRGDDDQNDGDEMSEQQIIQTILELGNQVLANLGVEEPIDDVSVFFSDQFYIQFFEGAFPDIDFTSLEEAQTDEEMADNIQALIDLLSEEILKYDLSHIKGEEIVNGNPEHCINLLQLAKEISLMIQNNQRPGQQDDMEQASEDGNEQLDQQQLITGMKDKFDAQESYSDADLEEDMELDQQMPANNSQSHMLEAEEEPLNMEDVSINVEDGLHSGDDQNLLPDHPLNKIYNMQREQMYDPEVDDDMSQQEMSDNIEPSGGSDDQLDQFQQRQDPLELAQEAMMDQSDEADKEIEQIINKKGGQQSDEFLHPQDNQEEYYRQQQQQDAEDDSQNELEQMYRKQQQQKKFEDESMEDQYDEAQDSQMQEMEPDEEGNTPIHPDLIAAAQEMGLDLNSDQMRELQQYIVQQNIVDESEEGEYDVEEDPNQQQQQLEIKDNSENKQSAQKQQPIVGVQDMDEDYQQEDQAKNDDDDGKMINLNELDENEKFMLLQYLEEEYDRNPSQFPFSKEHLSEIIEQENFDLLRDQIRLLQQRQRDANDDEDIDDHLQDENDPNIQIEAGENQIEQEDDYQQDDDNEDDQIEMQMMHQQKQQDSLKKPKQKRPQTGKPQRPKPIQQSNSQKALKQPKKGSASKQRPVQQQQQPQPGFDQDINQIQYTLPPGAENMDPQLLQQILLQQQQHAQQQQAELKAKKTVTKKLTVRPQTAKNLPSTYGKYIQQQSQTSKMGASSTAGHTSERGRPSIRQSKRRRSKKAKKTATSIQPPAEQVSPTAQAQQAQPDIPIFNEEYLNQLNEEQLQELLQQQQALMQQQALATAQQPQPVQQQPQLIQQQQSTHKPSKSRSAGKRSSSADRKTRQQRAKEIYLNPQHNLNTITMGNVGGPSSTTQRRKTSAQKQRPQKPKKTRKGGQPGQGNSVMLNNFFPALNEQQPAGGLTSEEMAALQLQQAMIQNDGGQQEEFQQENMQLINEVPLEEEEGESQDVTQSRKNQQLQQQYQQMQSQPDQNEIDDGEDVDEEDQDQDNQQQSQDPTFGLSDEQLMELLQNANMLSVEQQAELQQILKQRWKKDLKSQKKQQYNNIYTILTENVAKAKQRLASLNQQDQPRRTSKDDEETLERIRQQKREYEALMRQQDHSQKTKQRVKEVEQRRAERTAAREAKLAQLREKKFEEELLNQQKSLMYKRNAQQVRLCQKVYKLASDLEKNKLLEEKREFRETQAKKKEQKKSMVDNIEAFYRDKISMLKERIETERFERKIAQQAQQEALSRMKREVTMKKKLELQKYLALLKQEDQKFDLQSSNLVNLEQEIIKLYKK